MATSCARTFVRLYYAMQCDAYPVSASARPFPTGFHLHLSFLRQSPTLVFMDLYFSRRRLLQTSFFTPLSNSHIQGQLKETYRVGTTVRKGSILPDTTTIEYVGAEDEEKHYTVATVDWCWPCQSSSSVEIDGKRLPIKEFLKREGLLR